MKNGIRWAVVDTETDGLYEPIHVVELSAQLMEGWDAVGDPFRMLLNHNVAIPDAAVAIHGYTQEYLAEHGQDPTLVHNVFRDYVGDAPLVAHNLSYDWNRCLQPEWNRLGLIPVGQRGFCSMMLARRLVSSVTSYRLEILKQQFNLKQTRSHQATNDVLTVVELFQNVYRTRLEPAGLDTFESVAAFSKRTPVAKCLDLIRTAVPGSPPAPVVTDAWYFIAAAGNPHGPLPANEVSRSADLQAYYVWRVGMQDWVANAECQEFLDLVASTSSVPAPVRTLDTSKTKSELLGICRGLLADDKITTAEVMFLNSWLQDFGHISEWPGSEIAHAVERILEDGVVTKQEKEDLKRLLKRVTAPGQPPEETKAQVPAVAAPVMPTEVTGPYVVIQLDQGTPEWQEWRRNGIGASDASAIVGENRFKDAQQPLREKRGQVQGQFQNAAMARGTALEPEARAHYIKSTGVEVRAVCLQSTRYDWLRASLDGVSADGRTVFEIKCGESAYRTALQTQRPPDYYYAQFQHIMAVTGLPSVDFWCYLQARRGILIKVPRDEPYIERLLATELEFWRKLTGVC